MVFRRSKGGKSRTGDWLLLDARARKDENDVLRDGAGEVCVELGNWVYDRPRMTPKSLTSLSDWSAAPESPE